MKLTGRIDLEVNCVSYSITSEELTDHDLEKKTFCVIRGSNGFYNDDVSAEYLETALWLVQNLKK